jgi:hypothetical protein
MAHFTCLSMCQTQDSNCIKPSATCSYSQALQWREALEHAHRQRRDLVVFETPCSGTHRVRVAKQLPHVCAQCNMMSCLRSLFVAQDMTLVFTHQQCTCIPWQRFKQYECVHKYKSIQNQVHKYTSSCIYVCGYVKRSCMFTCICMCVCTCKHVHNAISVYFWLKSYMCVYLSWYTHTHTHTHICVCMYVNFHTY